MGIVRLVIVVGALYLLYRFLQHLLKKAKKGAEQSQETKRLEACSRCGLHMPVSQLKQKGNTYYCKNCL